MSESSKDRVVCCASFDNMRAQHVRLLHEASRLGPLHVYLWDDSVVEALTGQAPKFPAAEREYYLQALRYVEAVTIVKELSGTDALPDSVADSAGTWVVPAQDDSPTRQAYCQDQGVQYRVLSEEELAGFPEIPYDLTAASGPKVLVTGCYDWFHTGHVRFFEEVSELGDLYVVVGHDANILKLKGPGHPMFKQDERRYLAGSIRYVTQALVSSGDGWLDAEPEIERIKPDKYAVNEDGDKPIKREYCAAHGIEYVVLKRLPKPGLTRRESTQLRGF